MNEHLRGKRLWIGLGALAFIGLCLVLCLGAVAFVALHPGQAHRVALDVQPSAGQEGGAVPPTYHGPGGWGMDRPRGFGPVGLLFRAGVCILPLLFFGLIFFLVVGLARRRCWGRGHWGPPPGAKSPEGENQCGPWAWRHHGQPWGPPPGPGPAPESPSEKGEPEKPDTAGE